MTTPRAVTTGTIQASITDLEKQLLAVKQQVEDGKAAAQQLTAKHDKEKAELVHSMEAERQLEQQQMKQISMKNDEARHRVALVMIDPAAGCRFDSRQRSCLPAPDGLAGRLRCAQELEKKKKEFEQAEAKLLEQNDTALKTLQDKLVCARPP